MSNETATNGAALVEKLNWRYAVKKFDASKKITKEQWQVLEDSAVLTPSSYGLQPWKFIVVQNPELRKKLRAVSWNQSQVEDCSHFIVFAARSKMAEADIKKYIDRIVEVRKVDPASLKGYFDMMVGDVVNGPRSGRALEWASRQCYIALGQLMTTAALLQVDTCPMEGLEPEKYDELLGLKGEGYATVMALAVGFRSSEDGLAKAPKVRFKNSDIIQFR